MAAALASVSDLPSAKTLLSMAAFVAATAVLVRSLTNDLLPGSLQEYITGSVTDLIRWMAAALASASDLPSAKTLLSAAASVAATGVLVRTMTNDLLPDGLHEYIAGSVSGFFTMFSTTATMVVEEYRGFSTNHIYRSAEAYLGDRCLTPSTRRIRVSKEEEEPGLEVTVDRGEEVKDVYRGVTFKWVLVSRDTERAVSRHGRRFHEDGGSREVRHYELRFHKKYREMVLKQYLPYVVEQAEVMRARKKGLKIHTGNYNNIYPGNMDVWSSVRLNHPATFETLAMEPERKREIIKDLDRFLGRKQFYRRVGKAWKRGYLLYGPPGTGKSSLIAAMANHLHYHIYDLELTQVKNNSDLRNLLLATSTKSILVIEDIDCSVDLKSREEAAGNGTNAANTARTAASATDTDENGQVEKMTLSGLLNVIDGLWSSCGEERIIIFTTNYKDRLDPALLRPGRMDVHIHMSYCTPAAFPILLTNYFPDEALPAVPHELKPLLAEVDALLAEVEITPAEVAEELMRREQLEPAVRGLIGFMKAKKEEKTGQPEADIPQKHLTPQPDTVT